MKLHRNQPGSSWPKLIWPEELAAQNTRAWPDPAHYSDWVPSSTGLPAQTLIARGQFSMNRCLTEASIHSQNGEAQLFLGKRGSLVTAAEPSEKVGFPHKELHSLMTLIEQSFDRSDLPPSSRTSPTGNKAISAVTSPIWSIFCRRSNLRRFGSFCSSDTARTID